MVGFLGFISDVDIVINEPRLADIIRVDTGKKSMTLTNCTIELAKIMMTCNVRNLFLLYATFFYDNQCGIGPISNIYIHLGYLMVIIITN